MMRRAWITYSAVCCAVAALAVAGCSDDETNNQTGGAGGTGAAGAAGGTGGTGNAGGGGNNMLSIPTLGAQIDRNGRPAVNTAAYETFIADGDRDTARAAYNGDADPANWGNYVAGIASTIAILDSLDAVCGNQPGFGALGNPGYGTMATVLAHDWLLIDASSTECDAYLGVEASLLGLVPAGKCGGRTPSMDVVETSYSVLSGVGLAGFDDGIPAHAPAMVTTFPYLAAPN